jgi:sigma-B regulation protein RsbU (phosphoserine phosphatase)
MCDPDSSKILSEINELAHHYGLTAMTTAAVVAYDLARREFRISYAGHPPFLLKRANEQSSSIAALNEDGGPDTDLPLAIAPKTVYRERILSANLGDRLLVYTDGVIEAPNAEGDLFGTDRLRDVVDANSSTSLHELKAAVLQALGQHVASGMTHDDVTLIAIEVC